MSAIVFDMGAERLRRGLPLAPIDQTYDMVEVRQSFRIGDRVRWASGAGTIVEFLEAVRVDFDGPPEPHAVVSISEGERRGVRCVVPVLRLEHAPPAREGGAA